MPLTIPSHERERQVLEKRLKLLWLFDNLLKAGIQLKDLDELEADGTFKDFVDVLNPCDVCESIRAIYKPELYGPQPK
jgi:hypothetical protein